ncbi:MAG: hypothetical protein MJ108_06085 [Saccharofermentans sp.]|nr:hypothetical protein [Saccharofermentans sp.]
MDYLEGLFLGKLWSDTDFENRRHVGLFILYGLFVDILLLLSYIKGFNILGTGALSVVRVVMYIMFFLACPFLCFRYYRMPFWGKVLVLIEKFLKTFFLIGITISLILPRIKVQSGGLQNYLIDYLNSTLEKYTMKFAADGGSFSTVMGVLTGGIHVVLVVVLILAAAVILPGLIFIAFRYLQYFYDWVLDKVIIKKFFRYKR